MHRRDASDQMMIAAEVAAVHADIAHPRLRIDGDKRRGGANAAAESRLFDRRRQAGDAEFFQPFAAVNDLLNRRAGDPARLDRFRQGVAPLFIDF